MNNMTLRDWDVLLHKKQVVFARTSPEQKLTIGGWEGGLGQ